MSNSPVVETNEQFTKKVLDVSIKLVALLLIAVACFDIVKPFIIPMIWAVIIAVAVKPVSDWVEVKLKLSRKWSAVLVTLALLAALVTPAAILLDKVAESVTLVSAQVEAGEFQLPHPKERVKNLYFIGEDLYEGWNAAADNLEGFLEKHEESVKKIGGQALSKLAGISVTVLVLIFSVIIAGIFLANADGASRFIKQFCTRLAGAEHGGKFVSLAGVTVRNVTRGILGVAFLQATLAGLGFAVIGLPAAPLLAGVVLVMSIIQINPLLLMLPLAIYVFSFVSPVIAALYLIWSIAVGLMDNILKPIIMGKGADVPMMIIFLGAVGGFVTMGFIGLFVGAVILVVGYDLFITWLYRDNTG